jgi:hypothetical protein
MTGSTDNDPSGGDTMSTGRPMGGMAECRNPRCRQPFWASGRRVYCDGCLVAGDDRKHRARLRYERRLRGERELTERPVVWTS